MEVTYTTSRADMWRYNMYLLTRRPRPMADCVVASLIMTVFLFCMTDKDPRYPPLLGSELLQFLVIASVCLAVSSLCFVLPIKLAIDSRTASPNMDRICTTRITQDGVRDITPEQDQLLVWNDVQAIQFHNGDLYFTKPAGSIVVPRGAFKSPGEAQQFYKTALDLWRDHPITDVTSSVQRYGVVSKTSGGSQSIQYQETAGQLKDEETVLWQGSPNLLAGRQNPFSFMTVSLVSVGALATAFMIATTGFAAVGGLIVGWLLILGLITVYSSAPRSKAKQLRYALTDTGPFVSVQKGILPIEYKTMGYEQIQSIKYWDHSLGTATLEFGSSERKIDFYRITDAATVIGLIANARGQQPTDFEALFASRTNSNPFLDILRQGETLLWQGQPDREAYINEFWRFRGGSVYYLALGGLIFVAALVFSSVQPLWQQAAELAPFVLIAAWLVVSRYRKRLKSASTLFYAVTSQRLLYLDQSEPRFFAEAELSRIDKMRSASFASGVSIFSYGGKYANDLGFTFLANPDIVRQIIMEAKQEVSNKPMVWSDETEGRATKPKQKWSTRLGGAFILVILLWLPVELVISTYYNAHYYEPGMQHYYRQEYAAAIPDLRIATNATPNEQAPYYLGLALMRVGRPQEARRAFERAADRAESGRFKDHEMWSNAQSMINQIDAAQARATSPKHPH